MAVAVDGSSAGTPPPRSRCPGTLVFDRRCRASRFRHGPASVIFGRRGRASTFPQKREISKALICIQPSRPDSERKC